MTRPTLPEKGVGTTGNCQFFYLPDSDLSAAVIHDSSDYYDSPQKQDDQAPDLVSGSDNDDDRNVSKNQMTVIPKALMTTGRDFHT